jgi:hypothetical protein
MSIALCIEYYSIVTCFLNNDSAFSGERLEKKGDNLQAAVADDNSFRRNTMYAANQIPQWLEAGKMAILKHVGSIPSDDFFVSL